jgi:glycosyltransferase involved in cell wall biosynthesis
MDNQWLGTAKQWLGRLTWRQYIRPLFDVAFVPGDRQVAFANRLGFRSSHVLRGLLCADTEAFTPQADNPHSSDHAFLFVGRLTELKGVSVLIDAYRRYRERSVQPWPLRIVGVGPLLKSVQGTPGVECLGFIQPADLPKIMWAATCLVLPSRLEPWGVVVDEATIAGLIPICSERVGAAVHLVQDGYNGYVIPAENPAELTVSMEMVANKSKAELSDMGRASRQMSMQFSTDRWARYLVEMLTKQTTLGLDVAPN